MSERIAALAQEIADLERHLLNLDRDHRRTAEHVNRLLVDHAAVVLAVTKLENMFCTLKRHLDQLNKL